MAKSRPSVSKRVREKLKQERKQSKAEERARRAAQREAGEGDEGSDVDLDIAHIVPGPQKPIW